MGGFLPKELLGRSVNTPRPNLALSAPGSGLVVSVQNPRTIIGLSMSPLICVVLKFYGNNLKELLFETAKYTSFTLLGCPSRANDA